MNKFRDILECEFTGGWFVKGGRMFLEVVTERMWCNTQKPVKKTYRSIWDIYSTERIKTVWEDYYELVPTATEWISEDDLVDIQRCDDAH